MSTGRGVVAGQPGVTVEPQTAARSGNGAAAALRYFFVTGGHKSGTSWVSWMLNSHPEVCCLGAARFVGWAYSSDTWINEDNFRRWTSHRAIAEHWLHPVDFDEVLRGVRRAMIESIMRRKVQPGNIAVGDKTPMYYARFVDDLHALFPDAAIIHVIRDGRDVAVSHHFHMLRLEDYLYYPDAKAGEARRQWFVEGRGEPISLFTPESLEQIVMNWRQTIDGVERGKRLYGESLLELRYESLLERPEQIERAFSLIGVSTDPAIVAQCVAENTFARKSGGRQPGEEDRRSFTRKGVVGDWKNYFTEDDKALFKELAGDLLISLGYVANNDW